MSLLQEALDACATLTRRVEHLEYDKVAQTLEITKLKRRVKKLEKGNRVRVLKLRRLKKEDELAEVHDIVDVVTTAKLITEVVTAASEKVTAASTITSSAEPQVPAASITAALVRVVAASTRRRKGVVIRNSEEESTTSSVIPADTKSKDKGKGIMVEEPKPLKKKQQVELDEEYARKLHVELNKDIDWDVAIDHVKQKAKEDPVVQRYQGMSYDDIRLIFEAKFNSNIEFLLKTKEQIEEEDNKAIQSINETPAQKAAKRRKLNEEVEDLKRHLEIMPDEDDEVYTEATPLARKVPVVDYEIIHLNNKLHYKIIQANGTHQLYTRWTGLSLEESKDCTWSSKEFNAAGEELSAAKQKLMLLDSTAEGRINATDREEMGEKTYPRNYQYMGSPQKGLYLKGPIPGMTPAQALTAIQTIADHSQKWHERTISRNIRISSSNDGLAALDLILTKDYPLNEEVTQVEEVRYGEFGLTTPFNGITADQEAPVLNNLHGVSFIFEIENDTPKVLQHQLPPKELNPGSFTLPCMIGNFNFYAIADLDMSKMARLWIVENLLVRIDKFLFPSNFVIIDNTPTETNSRETLFCYNSYGDRCLR
nr:hypothetical protein [Tanacetum cinerariifolium]